MIIGTNVKAVMRSIRPRWIELIAARKKTIELGKDMPKDIDFPFKVYMYQSKRIWSCKFLRQLGKEELAEKLKNSHGKVVGEFVCHTISRVPFSHQEITEYFSKNSCVSIDEMKRYAGGKVLYAWHISDLVIYDKPKSINDFKKYNRDPENSACSHMPKSFYPDCSVCKECGLTRPPQSWCYVVD